MTAGDPADGSGPAVPNAPAVAVVTGGGRGIGAATARLLAREGWAVCVGYRSDSQTADAVVADCVEADAPARAVAADVGTEEGVASLFAAADEMGRLGGLINNAGVTAVPTRVDELDGTEIDRLMAVNVVGAFLCAGQAVRRMSTRHGGIGGCIVNVSSGAVRIGSPGEYVHYAASKAALDTMTMGLAREVGDEGVRVNAVRPGLIDTDLHAATGQDDKVERLIPTVPMKRPGQPEEVAEAIAWLCDPRSSYVSGALLDVAGGR